jgi:citrate lyase beta subunit
LAAGEETLANELRRLHQSRDSGAHGPDGLPLIFVRVRGPQHLSKLTTALGELGDLLTGFVLPKFGVSNASSYLEAFADAASSRAVPWLAMPILEGPEIIYAEQRAATLNTIADILSEYRDRIPCVRLGGTDLSGIYGLRRSVDLTIYDIGVVRDCISDVVNVLGRPERAFVLSGPVWEYFSTDRRLLKPQLRESPFTAEYGSRGRQLRHQMVSQALDGLVREVLLDQANGLQGKTVIHPSHIVPVNALSAVSWEEFEDASAILSPAGTNGGARRSAGGTRMNEPRPHRTWATRVMERARAFGVLAEEHSCVSLLDACVSARRDIFALA